MSTDDPKPIDPEKVAQPVEELASLILDQSTPADEQATAALDEASRRWVVDLQWIDALLTATSPAETAAVERAMAATLAKLDQPSQAAERLGRAHRPALGRRRRLLPAISLSSMAVAATLAMALGIWWQRGAQQAMAMVERSYQAALAPRDRTYDVTVARTNGLMEPIRARLTVRGADKFLFESRGALGAVIRLGANGQGYWFIPATGPIVRAETDDFLPGWMRRTSTDLPHMQVSTLLERMRDYYRLQRLPEESLDPRGKKLSHLRATWSAERLPPSKHGRTPPEEVELWADPATGVVEQLVMTLPIDASRRRAHTVTLRLSEERHLGDEAYLAETYAPERESVNAPIE